MSTKQTIATGFDQMLKGVPEFQVLQRSYAVEARGLSDEERLRWIDAHLSDELRAELLASLNADGESDKTLLMLVALDQMFATWTEDGSPDLINALLNPSVHVGVTPEGVKYLALVVTVMSDLQGAKERLTQTFWREFPEAKSKASTVHELARAYALMEKGYSISGIAWEFLCDADSRVPRLAKYNKAEPTGIKKKRAARSRKFVKEHRRVYNQLRKLLTRDLETVTKMASPMSRNSS